MGFESLQNIINANKAQAVIDEELAQNPTECPDDAWPLDIDSLGNKSCPICGRIWGR